MNSQNPRVSVIIPTKNEAKLLPRCLDSLTRQKTSTPFEIIIVDSHSTDATRTIAKSHGARVIVEPKLGKVYAFRKGADMAFGSILCFTEADCILPQNWIETIVRYFDKHQDVASVCGIYTYHRSAPIYKILTIIAHYLIHGLHLLIFGHHSVRASNFAVRKSAYVASGGFAAQIMELYDTEIAQRLAQHGDIRVLPELTIQTSDRRVRGRIFSYLKEIMPAIVALMLRKPLAKQTYADIR